MFQTFMQQDRYPAGPPTHELDFLGIRLNITTATASLPSDKLVHYLEVVSHLADASSCSLRELKSLIGKLQFACKIIPVEDAS